MANILSAAEAAKVLRCDATDPLMLDLLTPVDDYIRNATGHDWAADSSVDATAKSAARMLITVWHENPGMMASGMTTLSFGLRAVLSQLEAKSLRYKTFEGLSGSGAISVPGAKVGDTVQSVIGVVGATGSYANSFESVITVDGYIQQSSSSDLSGKFFRAYLVSAESI
jgi:hypothetical protein